MYGVVLHAHPIRGESHIQRNTTREVATLAITCLQDSGSGQIICLGEKGSLLTKTHTPHA